MLDLSKIISLADAALSHVGPVSQEVITLSEGVRELAASVQQWLPQHEQSFSANITRLTGAPPASTVAVAPVTTAPGEVAAPAPAETAEVVAPPVNAS